VSYLSGPRLHFAGTFTADVSTVNNIPQHFKNPNVPNAPGWNPRGTGAWTISGCTVTGAVFADGTVAQTSADDPIVGAALAQEGTARLVDLDSEQQGASQIWGLRLRLTPAAGGNAAFAGAFKAAAFSDLWTDRFPPPDGQVFDRDMSAFWQSQLTGVAWNDLFGSRLLAELKQASAAGLLSIKFNVDGFDQQAHVGRIVGTIGPATADEPVHFVLGRQCAPLVQGPVWFFPAVVDQQRRKLVADFGNALQTPTFRGPFDDKLDLHIGMGSTDDFTDFGRIPIGPTGWYERTAGICEFPADRPLSTDELRQLASARILVVRPGDGFVAAVAAEGSDGLHVRADNFVYRMSARDPETVILRASRFGQPLAGARISLAFDDSQFGGQGPLAPGVPPNGLAFPASVTTGADGVANLTLKAGSIQTPRGFIDGQIYGVRYSLDQADPNTGYFDPSDFVSVLVWTDYQAPAEPNWREHVGPILTQYKQLYPVMLNFLDMSSYDSVTAMADAMKDVFSRPQEDPHYMPVTRDLSPVKRQMIVSWFDTTGNDGLPNLGPQHAVVAAAPLAAVQAGVAAEDLVAKLGGKSAALLNRRGGGRKLPTA
jgi:hypothetical protein